jgi:hypothetical protein
VYLPNVHDVDKLFPRSSSDFPADRFELRCRVSPASIVELVDMTICRIAVPLLCALLVRGRCAGRRAGRLA